MKTTAPIPTTAWFQNLLGKRYGRLVVVDYLGRPASATKWRCQCDCGKLKDVAAANLKRGLTTSCGCRHKEIAKAVNTTHGKSHMPEYKSWCAMRSRCLDASHSSYHRYGGRGITICERWDDFACFLDDMGPRPSSGHSLDRVDHDGHYEPSNCQWATRKQQQNNMSTNHVITLDGVSRTMAEWNEHLGLKNGGVQSRLRLGWSLRKALTTPIIRR